MYILVHTYIGEKKGEKPGKTMLTVFCNLLADGRAPLHLQPLLGGANGVALHKDAKPVAPSTATGGTSQRPSADGRPACSGEVWRRLVGKCLLSTEKQNLIDCMNW